MQSLTFRDAGPSVSLPVWFGDTLDASNISGLATDWKWVMFDWFSYLTFIAASAVIVIVPGPMVTLIIANSLRDGARAGLLNIAGSQVGLALMVVLVAVGLDLLIAQLAVVFDWLRLLGAAYLAWLGVKLLRSKGHLGASTERDKNHSYFVEGLLVMLCNPKALLFLGAFLPQFVQPGANTMAQALKLGLTFMLVAALLDGAYALVAGNARRWLSQKEVRTCEVFSGLFLIAGGLWLAFARR